MLTTEQRIGAFFIVGLVLFLLATELTFGLGLLRPRYPLYATFRDVQGLDVGADVRLAGLKAGRVDSMRIEEGVVKVRMMIDRGLEVKKDSVAKLDFRALSGERFIALSLGTPTARRAEPDDVLEGETPASFADVVDELSTVAENVSDLTESLKASSERLLANLADVVEENRSAIGDTAQHLASITEKLDRGTAPSVSCERPEAHDQVTATMDDVRQSAQDLGQVASNLATGKSTLGKLVTSDDGLYEQVRDTVASLQTTADNAQAITDDLRSGEGTIGKALTDETLYGEAQDTLRTVNRATQAAEDQSAISLLGTIVTSLF
jgi:phospholipid/cholesterol/gamma-HCH transport system substrate-binding protein